MASPFDGPLPDHLTSAFRALDRTVLERQLWQLGLALAGAVRKFGDGQGMLHIEERYLKVDAGESIQFAAHAATLYVRVAEPEDDG